MINKFVVGFSRSGAHLCLGSFAKAFELNTVSIYSELINKITTNDILLSHAPSMEILNLETKLTLKDKYDNSRIVALWRDPRDAFCSLFYYMEWRQKQKLDIKTFLYDVPIGPKVWGANRKPLLETFKEFVSFWWHEQCLHLRFEDLFLDEKKVFVALKNYWGLHSIIREENYKDYIIAESKKLFERWNGISSGDSDSFKRSFLSGYIQYAGEIQNNEETMEISSIVEDVLKNEIELLGYAT